MMLAQRVSLDQLNLIARADWRPFPTIDERAAWEGLPASVRAAYLAQGEALQKEEWPLLPAVRYLDFARDGNRRRYETPYFQRRTMLAGLVVAECLENKGRFLDDIANGIWLICEESSWCVPAHVRVQRAGIGLPDTTEPIVDLFAAETSALLAWVDTLLGDKLDRVSPLVRPRIEREMQARILEPYLARDDFGWMGFTGSRVNNWNPWINSNILTSTLLMEVDEGKRKATVFKCMRSIDCFVDPYPKDGGCDEGPGYWGRAGASLLDCLELLYSATGGQVDVYGEPLIQDIGRFIYRVQLGGDYFVNFADASAIVMPPAQVVYRYGQRIGDGKMMSLGAWIATEQDVLCEKGTVTVAQRVGLGRLLPTLFSLNEMLSVDPTPPLPRDVWLPEVQVMLAREHEGSSQGLVVAAKGGHNAESHNHNDVGSFVVYVDGKPVIVDAGVETYTRKTFSDERYTIWTMQSGYHSLLPTVDGVMQAPGRTFAARQASYVADESSAEFSVDIAAAYPPEARIARWQRTVTLMRGQGVEITDEYALTGAVGEIVLSLLTPCEVSAGPGRIALSEGAMDSGRISGRGEVVYDPKAFGATVERIAIADERLGAVWGERLNRIVFTAKDPPQQGRWTFGIRL
ncbi:MAG: heparinase II/III family protein [Anaerolineae bacterium]|nr:heparinase II/III family protein [Anaerolineae bacterium]